jgi:hypothetical protein
MLLAADIPANEVPVLSSGRRFHRPGCGQQFPTPLSWTSGAAGQLQSEITPSQFDRPPADVDDLM